MRDELKKITLTKDEGHLNQRQIRYCVKKRNDKISNPSETSVTFGLGYCLSIHKLKLFSDASVDIDQKYLLKSLIVSQIATKIARRLVTSR